MKILIVGAWQWPQYEAAFSRGLQENGVEVIKFSTADYFNHTFGRIQLRIPIPGPIQYKLNHNIIRYVRRFKPHWVLFWRPTHILPSTITSLKKMSVGSISYNNDDPFGPKAHGDVPWHHHWLWYWYLKCLPFFDLNFFYRKVNCTEAKSMGVRHAEVLLPYFIPWQDRKIDLTEIERKRFATDVVFIGHYEPDGREKYIQQLVNSGIKVKIWGGSQWNRNVLGGAYEVLAPIITAEGEEYAKALSGSKICLCFLSKLNRDTYTRRCFEIPACERLLLAERTRDLEMMFKEDEEACFFSTPDEAVSKVNWLLENPEIRERIAQAGAHRIWKDGGDVFSRAKSFLQSIK
jgi:spore maturation protein CgeB